MRAFTSVLVDQSHPSSTQLGEFRLDIGDPIGRVVEFARRSSAVLRDRRLLVKRKKKLDVRAARLQPDGLDTLVVNDLSIDFFKAERLSVEAQRCLEVFDNDRNVVNFHLRRQPRSSDRLQKPRARRYTVRRGSRP